jgi:REP element-mobilizing transposase RayT
LLLLPSAELNDVFVGLLGKAQREHGLEIHACVALSNHFHLLVSPESAHQLADFMAGFTSQLAREVARLRGWEGPVFPTRYRAHVVTDEEPAQVEWLTYVLSHGCKEGLVARPEDWPGVHSATALVEGQALQGSWIDRSAWCDARRRRNPPSLESFRRFIQVHLTPLPCWSSLGTALYRRRIAELLRQIEDDQARERARTGHRPLGRSRILEQDPLQPVPPPPPRPSPWVLAASAAARQAFVEAYRDFVQAFREAAQRLKDGALSVAFPTGSFPPALPRPSG